MNSQSASLLVRMENISKSFPGVRALRDVSFDVRPKEVHVLVGENGAGKSTLVKILSGAYQPDAGKIWLDGKSLEHLTPNRARMLGIAMIYQEFNLIPDLSVAENIFLGRLPRKRGWLPRLDWARMRGEVTDFFRKFGMAIDPDSAVKDLSIAQQQLVEVAKALSFRSRVIILDEPTATLTDRETAALFELLKRLKEEGIGIIYISHRLEELQKIGDRVTVFRDGTRVGTWKTQEISSEELIRQMVGRRIEAPVSASSNIGEVVLKVREVSRGDKVQGIDFEVKKGEILGFAGLVGAGRTELARVIYGADQLEKGEIWIRGKRVHHPSCRKSVNLGVGFLPEDRKTEGLILDFGLQENISLSSLKQFRRFSFIKKKKERNVAERFIRELSIRATGSSEKVRFLSGGNQQKVVLAKWLLTQAQVLIFDEPTRGIDVGAKEEFYRLIRECAERGSAVLFISSELSELLRLCDRILVLRHGRIAGEIERKDFSQEKLLSFAFGQSEHVEASP